MITLGLDLSLTETGTTVLKDGNLVSKGVIKSKPSGKRPCDEVRRIQGIVNDIKKILDEHNPDMVILEGIAFMARNTTALAQLAGLSYMVRSEIVDRNIPFLVVAPTSLKKFATGKGNAQKDVVMLETYKRYGVSILNNNECDAYCLSQVGLAAGGASKKITKTQMEVVHLISSQL